MRRILCYLYSEGYYCLLKDRCFRDLDRNTLILACICSAVGVNVLILLLDCNSTPFICFRGSLYPIKACYSYTKMCGCSLLHITGFLVRADFLGMRSLILSSFVISQSIPCCSTYFFHIPFIPFFEVLRMTATSCGIASTYRWIDYDYLKQIKG